MTNLFILFAVIVILYLFKTDMEYDPKHKDRMTDYLPWVIPMKDGTIINKNGSCYTIASEENPAIPLTTHHASDLTLYEISSDTPIYPIRRRCRPNTNTTNTQNQSSINVNDPDKNTTTQNTTTINEKGFKTTMPYRNLRPRQQKK